MKRSEYKKCNSSRRKFAKTLAAMAATPVLIGDGGKLEALAQQQSPEEPSPAAEALTQLVRTKYGKNLTEDQLKEIQQSMKGLLGASDVLKKFELKNSDEPDFVFRADLS